MVIRPLKNHIQLYYIIIYLRFLCFVVVEKWETYFSKILLDIFNLLGVSLRIKQSIRRAQKPCPNKFLEFEKVFKKESEQVLRIF